MQYQPLIVLFYNIWCLWKPFVKLHNNCIIVKNKLLYVVIKL